MNIKKIIGDKIYLSPAESTEENIEKFVTWVNDFNVTDYLTNSSRLFTRKKEKEYLEELELNTDKYFFMIQELKTDKLIGSVSLRNIDWIGRNAEIGILIGDKDYQSKGYGTEAIRLLLDYSFRYLNLHSISLSYIQGNERAHKCYLKCGFKDIGRSRERIYMNGKYYDSIHMDILKSEFTGEYIRNKNIKKHLESY